MFCPECQAEYREGITKCPDCDVALIDQLPVVTHPDRHFVPVFESADPALLPLVESLLDLAEIPYMIQGREAHGLLPLGPANTGVSLGGKGLAATVHVDRERLSEAKELLEKLQPAGGADPADGEDDELENEPEGDPGDVVTPV